MSGLKIVDRTSENFFHMTDIPDNRRHRLTPAQRDGLFVAFLQGEDMLSQEKAKIEGEKGKDIPESSWKNLKSSFCEFKAQHDNQEKSNFIEDKRIFTDSEIEIMKNALQVN